MFAYPLHYYYYVSEQQFSYLLASTIFSCFHGGSSVSQALYTRVKSSMGMEKIGLVADRN